MPEPAQREALEKRLADLQRSLEAVEAALLKNAKKPDLIQYTNYEYNRLSKRRQELEDEIAALKRELMLP